jgi:hypothetical protein
VKLERRKMRLTNLHKRYIKPIIIISLLAGLVLTVTGCEEFGFSPTEPSETEEKTEVEAPSSIAIRTEDRAILAVHEHLLSQAESYQAKVYLADLYAACDNWTAEAEVFNDGTSVWYVDMTSSKVWGGRAHWQQASWLVFQDGKVMPSNRLEANALRIEADLQELSIQPEPLTVEETEGSNGE